MYIQNSSSSKPSYLNKPIAGATALLAVTAIALGAIGLTASISGPFNAIVSMGSTANSALLVGGSFVLILDFVWMRSLCRQADNDSNTSEGDERAKKLMAEADGFCRRAQSLSGPNETRLQLYQQAKEKAKEGIALTTHPLVLFHLYDSLGVSCLGLNKLGEANQAFSDALELDPSPVTTHLRAKIHFLLAQISLKERKPLGETEKIVLSGIKIMEACQTSCVLGRIKDNFFGDTMILSRLYQLEVKLLKQLKRSDAIGSLPNVIEKLESQELVFIGDGNFSSRSEALELAR